MSRHKMIAYCSTPKCTGSDTYAGGFTIVMEHARREQLVRHIEDTVCPFCGSRDWHLSDGCER
jgi:hypothetical protein